MTRYIFLGVAFPFGIALILFGCASPIPRFVPGPEPTTADYNEREDCLYSYICPAIRSRGADPLTLETIGINANASCSGNLQRKLIYHYGPGLGPDLADRDRDKTEAHAKVVAESLVKQCAGQK